MSTRKVGLGLALLSHVFASCIPVLSKPLVIAAGPFGGGLILYLYSTFILLPMFAFKSERVGMEETFLSFLNRVPGRWILASALSFTSLSAIVFYVGLSFTAHPTIFGSVIKLDSMLPFILSILILKEVPSKASIIGAIAAFVGGGFVISLGSLEPFAIICALLFIILSALGMTATTESLRRGLATPNALVYLRQSLVLAVLALLVFIFQTSAQSKGMELAFTTANALSAAAVISLLFITRFHAQKRIEQWTYTTLGAIQPILMAIVGLLAGEEISIKLWIALALVVLGEFIAFSGSHPRKEAV